ncbi:uncharacterized protein LOC128999222 [Macrosteles quadrilineatus]|uniref:uncharacterized protein LOC128999222 n=1 Tax=Macrosteles quadrilineatus TaxID=74068 RepID=UPI0023E09B78|nr:uncharacterized protein LOC128999222 [Macrosteles quadrilineatus]
MLFLLLFMVLVPLKCAEGLTVGDVSTLIPAYALTSHNYIRTFYSETHRVLCFRMREPEHFKVRKDEYVTSSFVAILYTTYKSWGGFVAMAAIYPESCHHSLGDAINVKDSEFEVMLGEYSYEKKWAYFKDSKCKGTRFQDKHLPDTSWYSLRPQGPNDPSEDPHVAKSKVEDVLTISQQDSYSILQNLKITIHFFELGTKFVLKCFELNDEEREKLHSDAKYVSILSNDEQGTNMVLIMTSCENMDKNIINVQNNKMEVRLSNGNWAYFENHECKGKEFSNSQLPVTVWILQDAEDFKKEMDHSQVLAVFPDLSETWMAEVKRPVKLTAFYKEFVLNCYELEDEKIYGFKYNNNRKAITSKYVATIENLHGELKVKYLLSALVMKSCDNMDRNIINIVTEDNSYPCLEVAVLGQPRLFFRLNCRAVQSDPSMRFPYSKWTLQKPEDV